MISATARHLPGKFSYLKLGLGISLAMLGLTVIFVALAEGFFFSMFVTDIVTTVQAAPIDKNGLHVLNSLLANGRVSYLQMHTKLALAVVGFALTYFGLSLAVNYRQGDFSIKALFTMDYWIKFNVIRYKKTKIKPID